MVLPAVDFQTISLWFHVSFLTRGMCYVLDGREKIVESADYTHITTHAAQIGKRFAGAVAYINGSAAQPLTAVVSAAVTLSQTWQHVTIVMSGTARASLRLFARYTHEEGMDASVGRVLIYNRALTEAENRLNYDASF
jgi:hypothetical protein